MACLLGGVGRWQGKAGAASAAELTAAFVLRSFLVAVIWAESCLIVIVIVMMATLLLLPMLPLLGLLDACRQALGGKREEVAAEKDRRTGAAQCCVAASPS